jgi:hypothetical protein
VREGVREWCAWKGLGRWGTRGGGMKRTDGMENECGDGARMGTGSRPAGGGARTGKHTMRARTSAGTSCKPTLFTNATRTSQASARKNVPTSTGVCSLVTLTSNGRLKVYANRGFTIFWAPSPVSIFMAESRVDPRDRATFVKIVCILPVRFWV